MSNDTITQPQEDKVEETVIEQTVETAQDTEDTLEETLGAEVAEEKPKPKKPETVPIHVFEAIKKELKEEIRELKKAQGTSLPSDSSIAELAKEYDVNEDFVNKLAKTIQTSTMKDFDAKYSTKIAELENLSKKGDKEKKFNNLFEKTVEANPQFKGIANKDVIKQLAYNPENGKKTLSQILEDVYGHTIQGKKSMETAQPSGNREESVDFTKAGDPAVYAKIKSDPKLYKEYKDFIVKHINL
jgi:DNA-binding transcriptional regulator YhcF (GntR family)